MFSHSHLTGQLRAGEAGSGSEAGTQPSGGRVEGRSSSLGLSLHVFMRRPWPLGNKPVAAVHRALKRRVVGPGGLSGAQGPPSKPQRPGPGSPWASAGRWEGGGGHKLFPQPGQSSQPRWGPGPGQAQLGWPTPSPRSPQLGPHCPRPMQTATIASSYFIPNRFGALIFAFL